MKIRYLAVSCIWVLLFVSFSHAQAYKVDDRFLLVERDFRIPAHPGPGDRNISIRFTRSPLKGMTFPKPAQPVRIATKHSDRATTGKQKSSY